MHNWVEKFSQGRSKVVDEVRSGRPVAIATDASVQRVEEMIRGDRRVTIDSVAAVIGCSHGSAYSIMHDRLKFKKVLRVSTETTDGRTQNKPIWPVLAASLSLRR